MLLLLEEWQHKKKLFLPLKKSESGFRAPLKTPNHFHYVPPSLASFTAAEEEFGCIHFFIIITTVTSTITITIV